MNSIEAPCISLVNKDTPLKEISFLMDQLEKIYIDQVPWPQYSYKPQASFTVAHSNDCLFIKYYISEKFAKADYLQTNEPVYKDSCVEFFISFGEDKPYYNFEFNCAGTCLAGFGEGRENRQLLRSSTIDNIRRQTLLRKENINSAPSVYWELTIAIPLQVFCFHQLDSLKGRHCQINFYKCGDDLPEPHYLSWTPIKSAEPDFHLSGFFGEMTFA